MVENLSGVIITGIIASAMFEIIKFSIIFVKDKIYEKGLPFTISGYWCTYHEKGSYYAFEFVKIKHRGDKLKFRLYQKTNDGRFHFYKGNGYIRANKISFAYQEVNKNRSNHVGTLNLRIYNISEHCIGLVGSYSEFSKDEKECSHLPYELREFTESKWDKIFILLFRRNYIKRLMDREEFKNACRMCMF